MVKLFLRVNSNVYEWSNCSCRRACTCNCFYTDYHTPAVVFLNDGRLIAYGSINKAKEMAIKDKPRSICTECLNDMETCSSNGVCASADISEKVIRGIIHDMSVFGVNKGLAMKEFCRIVDSEDPEEEATKSRFGNETFMMYESFVHFVKGSTIVLKSDEMISLLVCINDLNGTLIKNMKDSHVTRDSHWAKLCNDCYSGAYKTMYCTTTGSQVTLPIICKSLKGRYDCDDCGKNTSTLNVVMTGGPATLEDAVTASIESSKKISDAFISVMYKGETTKAAKMQKKVDCSIGYLSQCFDEAMDSLGNEISELSDSELTEYEREMFPICSDEEEEYYDTVESGVPQDCCDGPSGWSFNIRERFSQLTTQKKEGEEEEVIPVKKTTERKRRIVRKERRGAPPRSRRH